MVVGHSSKLRCKFGVNLHQSRKLTFAMFTFKSTSTDTD